VPFHWTTAPFKKPVPYTVRVKAGPPEGTELGERLNKERVEVGVMVMVRVLEIAPLGFKTVMPAVPGAKIRFDGTKALSCAALINPVESPDPFH